MAWVSLVPWVPKVCLLAWLVPGWELLFQITRLAWLAGLLAAAVFSLLMRRVMANAARTQPSRRSWALLHGVRGASTAGALLSGAVVAIPWIWVAIAVIALFWWNRPGVSTLWRGLFLALGMAVAVSLRQPWLLGLMYVAELVICCAASGFWSRLESLPTRDEYVLQSGAACAAGGG
jgi:hypothetical protein